MRLPSPVLQQGVAGMPKSSQKANSSEPPHKAVRFVKSITLKNGRVIYASDYGHKAFPIRVRSGSLRRSLKRPRG